MQLRDSQRDVLLNVRMLTEGTDVPDMKTVCLTGAAISQMLLTQMAARALSGPKFGGTDETCIAPSLDDWTPLIDWAEYVKKPGRVLYCGGWALLPVGW